MDLLYFLPGMIKKGQTVDYYVLIKGENLLIW